MLSSAMRHIMAWRSPARSARGGDGRPLYHDQPLPRASGDILVREGETLVGRYFGFARANGRQRFSMVASRQERRLDFLTEETVPEYGAVFEVKNKASLSNDDVAQIGDFHDVARQPGAELWVSAAGYEHGQPTASQ